ncbi:hypothetical protein D2V17_20290 [Aurantiacibacter xanthus]|uniref:Uncharacterized protein n=1 Tax=Aurantiacibacter xanthus TaxID=1784712 RepID=A0A3A1P0I3_9SPHN|nr:hypothetical protein D2V17_20290 [Aurantiacibacter xanthus]
MGKASEHGRPITPVAYRAFATTDDAIPQRHDLYGSSRTGDEFLERSKIGDAAFTCRVVFQRTCPLNNLDAITVERESRPLVMDRADWNDVLCKREKILV